MNLIQFLNKKGLLTLPGWLPNNVHYLAIMGSSAYGVADSGSDMDVYGFCVPPKELVWPHLAGEIPGFGRQLKHFNQWQQHHVLDRDAHGGKGQEFDFAVFSIVRFFQLCMENNPNMVDALFVPAHCVLHQTTLGQLVRENRRLFLHRGCWQKFKGYAYGQLSKMHTKTKEAASDKRRLSIEQFGYDTKYAYHLVRLLLEVEEILTTGDLTLDRNSEQLKAIRSGQWSLEQVKTFFHDKERDLEQVYNSCTILPYKPDEQSLKALLLRCLEMHYDELPVCTTGMLENAIREAQDALQKVLEVM